MCHIIMAILKVNFVLIFVFFFFVVITNISNTVLYRICSHAYNRAHESTTSRCPSRHSSDSKFYRRQNYSCSPKHHPSCSANYDFSSKGQLFKVVLKQFYILCGPILFLIWNLNMINFWLFCFHFPRGTVD